MARVARIWILGLAWLAVGVVASAAGEDTLRVATYNLRNYLTMDRVIEDGWRPEYPKPEDEKRVAREIIRRVAPDILALQEVGGEAHLLELQADLAAEGLVYRGRAILDAADPDRCLGALWKAELAIEPVGHADVSIRYFGETSRVKRGMLELRVRGADGRAFASVFVLHLKSKYTDDPRDPQSEERRTLEARAARDRVIELFPDPASARFLIVGDLNDGPASRPLLGLTRRGELAVARPLECLDESALGWTHFYKKGGMYAQVDYILVSPGWTLPEDFPGGRVDSTPDFYTASDHRMVWADLPLPDAP